MENREDRSSQTMDTQIPSNNPWDGIIVRKAEEAQPSEEVDTPNLEEEEANTPVAEQNSPEITEDSSDVDTSEETKDEDFTTAPETKDVNSEEEEDFEETEVNPYYYLSAQLKNDGFLPDDFEATEEVTGFDVYSNFQKKLSRPKHL